MPDYTVRQARKLFLEKGLLGVPNQRKGKKLKAEIVEKVISFYQSDEHSRLMPGMKDVVSIGKKN